MSLPKTSNELAQDWIKNPDGSYSKRAGAVGGLRPPKPQPNERSESEDRKLETCPDGASFRISIVQFRHRLLDEHDNLPGSAKPLVDHITRWLGFTNDNDPRLEWRYHQIRVERGESQGVIVKIERTV